VYAALRGDQESVPGAGGEERRSDQVGIQSAVRGRQNTERCARVSFDAREKRGSGIPVSRIRDATYSPTKGPCLNPWPEPPPTSQTLSNCGCLSIRKSPLEVF